MPWINPDISDELKRYGATNPELCFNCGNCSAICALSDNNNSFPRKTIRFATLGLEDELEKSLDSWLCYYCGECSSSCPRNAEPGNLMMSVRRYLVSKYDWTGLSRKFYMSAKWEIGAVIIVAAIVLMAFLLFHGEMTRELTSQGGVKLNSFAPWRTIEIADWCLAGLLSFFLLSNIISMYVKVIGSRKDLKIPLKVYLTELWKLPFHFVTQFNFSKCETEKLSFRVRIKNGKYNYWLVHFLLMSGYVILFTMIVGFLEWFQTDSIHRWYHPQRILGYYSTLGLMGGVVYFSVLRLVKKNEKSKKSHPSDWIFLIMLFGTTLTGILLHCFRINGFPTATYLTYVIHMMILFPMLIIEVPFSKWSHLAYRPFAVYFSSLIKRSATR